MTVLFFTILTALGLFLQFFFVDKTVWEQDAAAVQLSFVVDETGFNHAKKGAGDWTFLATAPSGRNFTMCAGIHPQSFLHHHANPDPKNAS